MSKHWNCPRTYICVRGYFILKHLKFRLGNLPTEGDLHFLSSRNFLLGTYMSLAELHSNRNSPNAEIRIEVCSGLLRRQRVISVTFYWLFGCRLGRRGCVIQKICSPTLVIDWPLCIRFCNLPPSAPQPLKPLAFVECYLQHRLLVLEPVCNNTNMTAMWISKVMITLLNLLATDFFFPNFSTSCI